jgi:Holliday junction resolvase-like predicted endonuclease
MLKPCRYSHNRCFGPCTGRRAAACVKKRDSRSRRKSWKCGVPAFAGETYAYGYSRRQGYVFVARNYTPRGIKGEIDLVGYDGKTLAFVEVRTLTVREDLPELPKLTVTREKQHLVVRTARRFLVERHVGECPCRFDVMAIDNCPGQPPVARLHKDTFSPKM